MKKEYRDRSLGALRRIKVTIKAHKENRLDWLEDFNKDAFSFSEYKYGYERYEHYRDNQLYGYGSTVRYIYGLEGDYPLKCVLPHFINSPCKVVWSKEILADLPIACYSDYSRYLYTQASSLISKKSILFACVNPFLSILNKVKKINKELNIDQDSKGCLYFPIHSSGSRYVNMHKAIEEEKKKVENLRRKHGKVNLCIYYIDYILFVQNKKWDSYQSLFDKVYCCGSRFEPSFLVSLAIIMLKHGKIATNGVGSHIFYSSMAGLDIEMLDNDENNDIYKYHDKLHSKRNDMKERIAQIKANKNFHNMMCNPKISQKALIERNYYKVLTTEEESECREYLISNQIDDSHYSSRDDFDKKLYPLVSW